MEDPLQTYARGLAAEIEDAVSSPDAPTLFSGEMFTKLVLERLEDAERLEQAFDLYQEGHTGRAGYRIDGYSIDDERGVLELFTTIYTGEIPPVQLPMADVRSAFERALRFARASMEGLADKLEPSNSDASDLARRIEREADRIVFIKLTLLTDQLTGPALPADGHWSGRTIEHDAFDIARLHRILGEGETRSDIAVDLRQLTGDALPCLPVRPDSGGYEAFLTVIPGEALSRIYQRYGVRLLELNVRAFLGIQGRKSVNSELRRTIADEPSMFLAYNNGLVATVDEIEFDESGPSTRIVGLKGLQIVNGGQTTASLHRASFKDRLPLLGVEVPVKIIRVTSGHLGEMVSSISRAANRQNTVQQADFSSNDPFHQQVEELANNCWLESGRGRWFYERARGSYLAAEQKASYRARDDQAFRLQTPRSRRLSKLDLARYLNAWSGQPYRVCLGGQKNFQHFMQRLRDQPPPPPDEAWFRRLIAKAILYRAAERIIRQMGFPAFRAQIVAYLVAGLSLRTGGRIDFEGIWRRQSISAELEDLLRSWAPQIDQLLRNSAGQRNPGEWFKRDECWAVVKEELPSLIDPLPPELANASLLPAGGGDEIGRNSGAVLSVEDFERIRRCMEIDSATWLRAAELGQRSQVLHYKMAGILRTLAGYAAGGWERQPSVRQAKPALDAMQKVREAGLLDSPGEPEEEVAIENGVQP